MKLDHEIRSCKLCEMLLQKHPENPPGVMRGVKPMPIVSDAMQAPIMLIGQAPGLTEYRTGRPFSGQAGEGIRTLFAGCGIRSAAFDQLDYQTSAVKCFPGRKLNGGRWEDRQPCAVMRDKCAQFLRMQIEIVRPTLIVTLGGFASKALDKLIGKSSRKLFDVLGTRETWEHRFVVRLTHTSGGNRALNDPEYRVRQSQGLKFIAEHVAGLSAQEQHPTGQTEA